MNKKLNILYSSGILLISVSQLWIILTRNPTNTFILINTIGIILIIAAYLIKYKEDYDIQNYYNQFDECGNCGCKLGGGGSVYMNTQFPENSGAGLGWVL
jgi:hypothetical protein